MSWSLPPITAPRAPRPEGLAADAPGAVGSDDATADRPKAEVRDTETDGAKAAAEVAMIMSRDAAERAPAGTAAILNVLGWPNYEAVYFEGGPERVLAGTKSAGRQKELMLAGRRPAQSVIIDAAKRFVVAYNAGDETGLRQLLADDAVFCLGELCVAGRDQVVAHLARSGFLFGKRALVVEGAFNQSGCKV